MVCILTLLRRQIDVVVCMYECMCMYVRYVRTSAFIIGHVEGDLESWVHDVPVLL